MKIRTMLGTIACGAIALAAGCGGGDSAPPLSAEAACSALQGKAIPASSISLSTSGGSVTSATLQAANATTGAPEFCKVTGALAPVDPQSFPINFQVNLPTNWNGKAMHLGGGGYNGTVVTGEGNVPGSANAGTAISTPLMRGYATFGSDSGHPASSTNWGLNAEALRNFGGDKLKKTLDGVQVPAPAGKATSPQAASVSGKEWRIEENPDGIKSLRLTFDGDRCTVETTDAKGKRKVDIGTTKWIEGSVPEGIGTRAVAGRGAWSSEDRFDVKLCYVDGPFSWHESYVFDGDKLTVEKRGMNVSFGPVERPALKGTRA